MVAGFQLSINGRFWVSTEVVTTGGGRPAAAFLGGQTFNIVVTLVAAYAFFGGWLFAIPDLN